MTQRTAKFVSAIVASFLAGAPFTTPSHSATAECVAGPKGPTPAGSHWYYRVDHATQRHCWYLGEGHAKLSQASPASSQVQKPALEKTESVLPRAVADAHAELISAPENGNVSQAEAKTSADEIQPSIIASRWPDQALPNAPLESPANDNPNSVMGNRTSPAANTQLASIETVEQLATADAPSSAQGYSLQMLLAAIAGTLASAGIVAGLLMRFRHPDYFARASASNRTEHQNRFARNSHSSRDRASEFFAQISRRHSMQDNP